MGRLFDYTLDQYYEKNTSPITKPPLGGFMLAYRLGNFAGGTQGSALCRDGTFNNRAHFNQSPDGYGALAIRGNSNNAAYNDGTPAGAGEGTWFLRAGSTTSSPTVDYVADGTIFGTPVGTYDSFADMNQQSIGTLRGIGSIQPWDGAIAEVGWWSIDLSTDEEYSLSIGAWPPYISMTNLKSFVVLNGQGSKEADLITGEDFTEINGPIAKEGHKNFRPWPGQQ